LADTSMQVVSPLLQQCHFNRGSQGLERVIYFLEMWAKQSLLTAASARPWVDCAEGLFLMQLQGQMQGMAAQASFTLTPAACIVAFLLGSKELNIGLASSAATKERLVSWLRNGLCGQAQGREGIVSRGYVASVALECLAQGQSREWWSTPASALRTLVSQVLLPSSLLNNANSELDTYRYSAVLHLLPAAAVAWAKCIGQLVEADQMSHVIEPLEHLSHDWAAAWDGQSKQARGAPLRQYFASLVFFLVGTVVRNTDLSTLGHAGILSCVRALAYVDMFHQDTLEYRAVCRCVVERGAEVSGFTETFLKLLGEFYSKTCNGFVSDVPKQQQLGNLSCLHFLLGLAASRQIIGTESFLPSVWPIILGCIRNSGTEGPNSAERASVAARAHALTAVCVAQLGAQDRTEMLQEYVETSIAALQASPNEDVFRALQFSTSAFARDVAMRCDKQGNGGDARALQRWLLQTIGASVLASLGQQCIEAAAGLFQVLSAAAEHIDLCFLPEPFYSESKLQAILEAHPPIREMWLRCVVSRFPERCREVLIRSMVDAFPDIAAAASPDAGVTAKSRVTATMPPRSAL